jgi:iron complex outermembrane recepter protein
MKRIAFFSFSFWALSANAQFKDTTELLPVEIKAVRASSTAPFAKTTISKTDIRRQNLGQDLPFLLNQTPSVVANSDAGNGVGYTGIRIRGTDATRINVTLNGIPFNDAESQGTFFVNLPDFASSVQSIQIQRGAGTSTNGPSAFGATINLNTNEVIPKGYLELNNSYGSFNTLKNTIKAGTGLLSNHFTADLRLSQIVSDGYVDRATSDLKAIHFSGAYLSKKTDLRLNVFSGKEKTYQAWYGISEADLKTNRRINYAGMEKPGSPYENETDNYQQTHYQLFFTQRFQPELVLNTALFYTRGKGYYEQYKANQKYSRYGFPDWISGSDTVRRTDLIRRLWLNNDFYGATYSLQYSKNKTELILGGLVSRYEGLHFGEVTWAARGLTSFKPWYQHPASKNDVTVYGKWQQQLGKGFQSFADLQLRKVDYNLNGFRDNPDVNVKAAYSFFNPKFGLSYQHRNWLFYASYALAQKEPNRDDFEAGANNQPRPEQLHDWEAGIERKGNQASFSANLYYMKYKDQLVLTGRINDVGAYTRTNIPNSYRAGVELQGSYVFNRLVKAVANLAFSRNKISNFTEFIDDYDNGIQKENFYRETDISFSPQIVGGATITIAPFKSLSLDLISKYVGDQFLDNTGNEARKLNAFFVQDVRAVYQLSFRHIKSLELIGQVNNVFNKLYEPNGYTFSYYSNNQLTTENFYFPMAGINWIVGLNIRF